MPFKSKSQRRACHAKKDPNWPCSTWESETPSSPLPERLGKRRKRKRKKSRGPS